MKVSKEKVLATLPNECLICNEVFNKDAHNILNEWHIIQKGQYIGLYCSMCWEHSKETAELYLESEGKFIKD